MQIYQTLLQYSVWLLARRAYSEHEIRKKLLMRAAKIAQRTGAAVHGSGAQSETESPNEQIDRVIQRLHQLKYLDDATFAKNYLAAELRRKPQSIQLVKQKLAQKGLGKEQIAAAICARAQITDSASGWSQDSSSHNLAGGLGSEQPEDQGTQTQTELSLARAAAEKKLKTLRYRDARQKKEKLYRFLAARGFGSETIFKVINSEA